MFALGQDYFWGKGSQVISGSYDLIQARGLLFSNNTSIGPVFLNYEYGLNSKFGVGLDIGYSVSNDIFNTDSTISQGGLQTTVIQRRERFQSLRIHGRFNYHLDFSEFNDGILQNVDAYMGLGLGYGYSNLAVAHSIAFDSDGDNVDRFLAFEVFLGGRYYLYDKIGVSGEIGTGLSQFKLGLSLQIK